MNLINKAFKGITMPQFYKWGSILFSFGLIGAGINAKMQWASINIGGKISMVSSFFFQCLILTLFLTLYFQFKNQPQPSQQPQQVIDNPEMDKFLKELQAQDNKEKGGVIKNKNDKKNNINH